MTMPDRYRILLGKQVAAELEAIFDHIAKDSVQNASNTVQRILDAIESLNVFPHRNQVQGQSPRIKKVIRSLPVKPYVIFFHVDDGPRVVRILSVRHGARKRPRRYR